MTIPAQHDPARLTWIAQSLYVPVLCDVLDTLGFRHQAMHPRLRPLDPDHCTLVGRARTFRWMQTDHIPDDPYGPEIDGIDSLKPGDVIVHSTDHALSNVPWGELMTTVAQRNGAAGCVCDSNVRDCRRIIDMKFPVFAAGILPLDSKGRGRVMAVDVPVACGGVVVHPNQLIIAGYDGIVAVPEEAEDRALELAAQKVTAENQTRRELLRGRTLRDVYDEYGVL